MKKSMSYKVKLTKEEFRTVRTNILDESQPDFAETLGYARRAATVSDKEKGSTIITLQDEKIINLLLENKSLESQTKKVEDEKKFLEDKLQEVIGSNEVLNAELKILMN